MKPNWQFPFVLLSILATVSSLQEWDEKHSIGSSNFVGRSGQLFNGTVQYSDRRIGNQLSDTERNDTIIIHRCRAQEFSPGAALGVMIVLATGSVLQMPGSLLSRKSSLYRLAPELGILELIPLLLLVGDACFLRGRKLNSAVAAVFLVRYQRQYDDEYQPRQLRDDTSAITENLGGADPFLSRIQTFGLSRILGDALMILAFIKSAAVRGTIRTTILAISYSLPFFTIELLSFASLRLNPRPKTRTQSQAELTGINNLIRTIELNRKSVWDIDPNGPQSRCYTVLAYTSYIILGLPAVLHLFWPFSVPGFLLFDFQEKHSASGKWVFSYLAWLMWVFWVAVVAMGVAVAASLPILMLWKFPETRNKYTNIFRKLTKVRLNEDLFTFYALLKFAIIVRFYCFQYTGQDTIKPGWLDWLG